MARDDKIDAGYFNKPVQFQSRTLTPDGTGGETAGSWNTVYSCFAHIEDYPGGHKSGSGRYISRAYRYQQLYPEMEVLVTIRYQASVTLTPAMTMLFKSRRYQILGLKIPHEELVTILIPVMLYQAPGTGQGV